MRVAPGEDGRTAWVRGLKKAELQTEVEQLEQAVAELQERLASSLAAVGAAEPGNAREALAAFGQPLQVALAYLASALPEHGDSEAWVASGLLGNAEAMSNVRKLLTWAMADVEADMLITYGAPLAVAAEFLLAAVGSPGRGALDQDASVLQRLRDALNAWSEPEVLQDYRASLKEARDALKAAKGPGVPMSWHMGGARHNGTQELILRTFPRADRFMVTVGDRLLFRDDDNSIKWRPFHQLTTALQEKVVHTIPEAIRTVERARRRKRAARRGR